jgi:hypothetical protein
MGKRNGTMRTVLAAISAFTVLATSYLSVSLVILRPPRANTQVWIPMAALFLVQGVLTLIAVAGVISASWIRWVVQGALTIPVFRHGALTRIPYRSLYRPPTG